MRTSGEPLGSSQSHYVGKDNLELMVLLLYFLRPGITGMCHYVEFYVVLGTPY